jgi:hypothetical protein
MAFIFDKFTLAGIISTLCTIVAVLVVLDCCKIRNSFTQKFRNE